MSPSRNTAQKGLIVRVTHCVVGGIDGFEASEFLSVWAPGFAVTKFPFWPGRRVQGIGQTSACSRR